MKLVSKKKWDELVNVCKTLYQSQDMMARQLNSLTQQVSILNAKVLTDAQSGTTPVVDNNEAHADRVLGGGQDGGTHVPR